MLKFLTRRILYAIFTLWVVVTLTFTLMMGIPGNPFAGEKALPPQVIESLNKFYKLDQPLPVQYVNYLKSVVKFDFGPSMRSTSIKVNDTVARGLPVSMQLGMQALVVALLFGITLGVIASLNHNKMPDYIATVIAIIGVSVPNFVLARLLIMYFCNYLGILSFGGWDDFANTLLPTFALAALPLATITRLMRSSMLDVVNQEYIKTAKAKGLALNAIIIKHALRNAIIPVVSSLGTIVTNLVTGSFIVEFIFGIPGLGDALIRSVENRDYPMIIAATVVYSGVLIFMTLIIDISYAFIDPRIKIVGGGKNG